jgi:hypothetical protein
LARSGGDQISQWSPLPIRGNSKRKAGKVNSNLISTGLPAMEELSSSTPSDVHTFSSTLTASSSPGRSPPAECTTL